MNDRLYQLVALAMAFPERAEPTLSLKKWASFAMASLDFAARTQPEQVASALRQEAPAVVAALKAFPEERPIQ